MRIAVDKIASSTRNVPLHDNVVLTTEIPASAGTLVVVRVLDDKSTYNTIEDVHGRMMTVHSGDVVVGVLGERRALRGFTGVVPSKVEVGDVLHLLNLGGVIGTCTSANPDVGPPARVEVLGGVLQFSEVGRRQGRSASITPGPIALAQHLVPLPPVVVLAGTCMHAGKTAAACSLVRAFKKAGLKVGAAKVTGVALRRDTLEMKDHGADVVVTFADAGLASTCDGGEVVAAAKGCLNHLATLGLDVIVVELGDGLMGEYGVKDVLADPQIRAAVNAVVLAANDPVGAWGGAQLLKVLGLPVTAVTGPATDNAAGNDAIALHAGVEAANALKEAPKLAALVLDALALTPSKPRLALASVGK